MAKGITSTRVVTIAQGAALSGAFNALGYQQMVILLPAAWTAASIGFQISDEAATPAYKSLYDAAGNPVEVTVTADKAYVSDIYGKTIKLWSETNGVSVNQAAARTITILLKA